MFGHAGYDVLPPPHVPGGRRRPVRRAAGQPLANVRVRVDAQRVPAGGRVRRRLPPGLVAAARRRRRRLRRLADFARLDRRLFAEHMLDVDRPGPQHRAAVAADRVLCRLLPGFLCEKIKTLISSRLSTESDGATTGGERIPRSILKIQVLTKMLEFF